MTIPGRLEILLEQIKNELIKQSKHMDGVSAYTCIVANNLEEISKTLKSINAHLAQMVSRR